MINPERATVCVSSQAGCAMGCTFCATGQAGFERHLDSAEIVEQVVRAQHETTVRVSHVVFMGMGEPLANVDPVLESLERLHDDFGLSARHLTVSTVGSGPGHAPPRAASSAGHARRLAARARRRSPGDDGAAQPPLPDQHGARRRPRVRGDQGPPRHLRVRVHRRSERPARARRPARRAAHRAAGWGPREPHPLEPDRARSRARRPTACGSTASRPAWLRPG